MPADSRRQHPQRHVSGREAIRFLMKDKESDLSPPIRRRSTPTRGSLDSATKFIPTWVKVAVAIALGLGTMIGWKRIVVTVGEKIGKTHLTYAQGACAEIVAMATIAAADGSACRSAPPTCCRRASPAPWRRTAPGCSWSTVRNIALAWVLTLPGSPLMSMPRSSAAR
jgi:inorganic phosphate transporter, PiT family